MDSSGSTLYGTTQNGGTNGGGTIFAINTDGTGFTNLHNFVSSSDGANPVAGLVLSGGILYGTAENGGANGNGTIFAINTNGDGFTNLYSFSAAPEGTNGDGILPDTALILSGNILYGTAHGGGANGTGTVFAVNTDGTCFKTLHSFSPQLPLAYSDGAYPATSLILLGNILYGTAEQGGSTNAGTIFAVCTNGAGFTNLHNFNFDNDGASPGGQLTTSGAMLYGAALFGGSANHGTIYSIKTDGTDFTTLYTFTAYQENDENDDGAQPSGLLVLGNTLFGTALNGGTNFFGTGTVFALQTDGAGFTNLHSFNYVSDGGAPCALILSGNTFYGTARNGGTNQAGTVFSFSLPAPPQLSIALSGTNIILSWTNTAPGFTLLSTANLSSACWSTVSLAPDIVNGLCAVTNPISATQQFYQLSR